MKRRTAAVITAAIFSILAAGCSMMKERSEIAIYEPDIETVFIRTDGALLGCMEAEAADEKYTADGLKRFIEAELSGYEDGGVAIDSVVKEGDILRVIYRYDSGEDYMKWVEYSNDDQCVFTGISEIPVDEAAASGIKVKNAEGTAAAYRIEGNGIVQTQGVIAGVSGNIKKNSDHSAAVSGAGCLIIK